MMDQEVRVGHLVGAILIDLLKEFGEIILGGPGRWQNDEGEVTILRIGVYLLDGHVAIQ